MNTGSKLPIMEEFLSVQGEGAHTGRSAWFIRLAGCDVGCSWCDVKESWEIGGYPYKSISELVSSAKKSGVKNVVVTGGEPTLYNLEPLTNALKEHGFNTWIETSGTNKITGDWDWVCLSPKKFKKPLVESLLMAQELKIIVLNKSDIQWGESMVSAVSSSCMLYFQPEWSKKEKASQQIIEFIKLNPKWSISIQTHKYLNIR